MRYEYRISEGIILRQPIDSPGKLEALGPQKQHWILYPEIDEDWLTNPHKIREVEVPPEALLAPTNYPEG